MRPFEVFGQVTFEDPFLRLETRRYKFSERELKYVTYSGHKMAQTWDGHRQRGVPARFQGIPLPRRAIATGFQGVLSVIP